MPPKAPRVSECEAGGLLRVKRADLVKMVRALKAEPDLERIVKARKTKDFNRKPTRAELCAAINARRKSMSRRKYLLLLGPALVALALGAAVWRREILGLLPTSTKQAEAILDGVGEMADHIRHLVPKYEPTTKAGAYMQAHPPHQLEPARAREIMRTVATLERERKQTLQRTAALDTRIVRTQQAAQQHWTEEQRRQRDVMIADLKQQRTKAATEAAMQARIIATTTADARNEVNAAKMARYFSLKTYESNPVPDIIYSTLPSATQASSRPTKPLRKTLPSTPAQTNPVRKPLPSTPTQLPPSIYGKAPVRQKQQLPPFYQSPSPYGAPPIIGKEYVPFQQDQYQLPRIAAVPQYEQYGGGRRPNPQADYGVLQKPSANYPTYNPKRIAAPSDGPSYDVVPPSIYGPGPPQRQSSQEKFKYQSPQASQYEQYGDAGIRIPSSASPPIVAGYTVSQKPSENYPTYNPKWIAAPSYNAVVPSNPTTRQRESDNYTKMSGGNIPKPPAGISPQVGGRRAATLPAPLASSQQYVSLPVGRTYATTQAVAASRGATQGVSAARSAPVQTHTKVSVSRPIAKAPPVNRGGQAASGVDWSQRIYHVDQAALDKQHKLIRARAA